MKKHRSTSAVILPFPSVRAGVQDPEQFEASAAAFLAGSLPAAEFLPLCHEAVRSLGNYRYKKTVFQYRFLALMALEQYYDATADAFVMLAAFRDAVRHLEMMCALCLRRSNYFKALEYVERLVALTGQEGGPNYEEERTSLAEFTQKIPRLSAQEFAEAFAKDEQAAAKRFRGIPLMLSGRGWIGVNNETRARFLTFTTAGSPQVRCRFHFNETPFLRPLIAGQRMRISGYFAFAADGAIYLDPCYLAM